jgi:hypothetical protein
MPAAESSVKGHAVQPAVESDAAGRAESPAEVSGRARWLRVCITDLGADRPKVTVRLPLGLVDVGWRLGARFLPSGADAETEALLQAVRAGAVGRIVSFENCDYGERVEVFIE